MQHDDKQYNLIKKALNKESKRKWTRSMISVFLVSMIILMNFSLMVVPVQADSISSGLSANENQIWQQGSSGLSGSPEGHLLVPTGGSGSIRNRGDEFGANLVTGDFNGDGLADLAIAAPDEDASTSVVDEGTDYEKLRKGNGAVSVIYSSSSASGLSASANNDQMWTVENDGRPETDGNGRFGFALAAGDFNGDGMDDLAVGAPYEREGGGVVILYGNAIVGLTSEDSQFIDQDTGGMNGASEGGDRFGYALASGQFNNDNYADLAIGVPGEDDDAGAVAVIYGSSTGLAPFAGPVNQLLEQGTGGMMEKAEDEELEQLNEDDGDNFGFSLAAGRFTPGLTDDLAIGVPGEIIGALFSGPGKAGAVHIVYSDNGGLNPNGLYDDRVWHQDKTAYYNGEVREVNGAAEGGDRFGYSLAAGNFGHDILEDLAIGIPGEDQDEGAVAILFGSVHGINLNPYDDQFFNQNSPGIIDEAEGNTLRGGDEFGAVLAGGNFNASKYDDLAIGIPGEDDYAGAVAVIYGDTIGLSAIAGPGNQLWRQGYHGILGANESSDMFGAAITTGDFNGDGSDGIAVGAPVEDNHAGAAYVIYAAPVLDQTPPVVTPQITGELGEEGWYTDTETVSVKWTVVDEESSDSLELTGCNETFITEDTPGTTVTCTATSQGGTTVDSVIVKRDSTDPNVTASFKTEDGEAYIGQYWTNQNVDATFVCEDEFSGVKLCPEPLTLEDEGDNSFEIVVEDYAGNSTTTDYGTGNLVSMGYSGIYIDKTDPVTLATVSGNVYGDGSDPDYYDSSEPVVFTLSVDEDGLSDLQGTEYRVNGGEWRWYFSPVVFTEGGVYEVEFRSKDHAGNIEVEKTETFRIWYDQVFPTITGTISPAPNEYGWNNEDVTVTFECDDNVGVVACPDPVLITDNVKNHPVEGIAIDNEGNKTSTTVYVNIDKTKPTSSHFIYGINDEEIFNFGWYWQGYSFEEGYQKDAPVRLYLDALDNNPDIISIASQVDYIEYRINLGGLQGGWQVYNGIFPVADGIYSVNYHSVDRAGNIENSKTFDFKTDLTPPTMSSEISPTPNEHGWNNEGVNVSFFCEDVLSGPLEAPINPPMMNQEGEGQVVAHECTDKAYNHTEITTTVNIDSTAPIISATATTEDGEAYVSGDIADQPVIVTFHCFDALSGMDLCGESQKLGEGMDQSVTGTAVDKAGNTATISFDHIDIDFSPPESTVQISASNLSVAEGGTSDSYTIVLGKSPLADVTVSMAVYGDDIGINPASGEIAFTPTNWNEAQTVTITAVNDSLVEEDESVTISHIVTSEDPEYNGIIVDDLIVEITDNDVVEDVGEEEEDENDGNNSGDDNDNTDETDTLPKSQEIPPNEQITITTDDGLLNISLPADTVTGGGEITVQQVSESTIIEPGAGRIRIGEQIYNITIEDSNGNDVRQLNRPIELVFQYDLEDLPEGIAEEDLRIFYWDEEFSSWFTVPTKQDTENNTVIATVDHLTVFTIIAAPDLDIANDIGGHWAESDILKLYSLELINGYEDGTYRPERELTRAEFIVLLARAYGLNPMEDAMPVFTDTVPDWAAGYVAAAIEAGWVNGYADGSFRANTPITREQVAVLAIRALGGSEPVSIHPYNDKKNIAVWAHSAVAKVTLLGLMTGYEDDNFLPQAVTTRAEASVILFRILQLLAMK